VVKAIESAKELEKVDQQMQKVEGSIQEMTLDKANAAPKEESEPQTKLSMKEMAEKVGDVYLKPKRSIMGKDKFNENFRKDWEFDKEYVRFIAENKEIIGETIDLWTKHYGAVPAEEWEVPTNKPVYGPRYLAERIKACSYHRFFMQDKIISDGAGIQQYGHMTVDKTIQRLDAYPVTEKKSIFMGSNAF
jgi:hypothetical protein